MCLVNKLCPWSEIAISPVSTDRVFSLACNLQYVHHQSAVCVTEVR